MGKGFDAVKWDPSFVWNISAGMVASSSELQAKLCQSLRWEISEELLFMLIKDKRLSHPFDERIWCPLSVSLLTKCLHLIVDHLLMGRDHQILFKTFMGLARNTADTMKNIIHESGNSSSNQAVSRVGSLAFAEKSNAKAGLHVLIVEAVNVNKSTVEDYMNDPKPLDLDWYLIHQVVLAVHPVASLIDWSQNSDTGNSLYSIEKLNVGLEDASYLAFYTSTMQEWCPLVNNETS